MRIKVWGRGLGVRWDEGVVVEVAYARVVIIIIIITREVDAMAG